jgi:NADH:ubiquinone oxidoreductase subunit D
MMNHVIMATRVFNRRKNAMGIVRRISLIEFAVKGQRIRASSSAFVVNRNHHSGWSCQSSTVVGRWNDMII